MILIGCIALVSNYYFYHVPKLKLNPQIEIIDRKIRYEVKQRRLKKL